MDSPTPKSLRRRQTGSAMYGIVVHAADGKLTLVNQAFCRMSGYTRGELLRMPVAALLDPHAASGFRPSQPPAARKPSRFKATIHHKDGRFIPVNASAQLLKNGDTRITTHTVSERSALENALAEERDFLQHAVNSLPGSFYVMNSRGEYLFWNKAFQELGGYGYSADDIRHLTPGTRVAPEHRALIREEIRNAFTRGYSEAEAELLMHDGRRVPYHVMGRSFEWRGEKVLAGMAMDISARVAAERELWENQQHYQDMVESARDGIFLRRASGELLYVNDALCELTGYSRVELLHMTVFDLPAVVDADMRQRVQWSNEGRKLLTESRLRQKHGGSVHVEVNSQRLANGNVQGIVRDVHERVEAREAYMQERNFMFNAVNSLPGIFYVFDEHGKFLRWNHNFEQLFGYSSEEIPGIRVADLVRPERRLSLLTHIRDIFERGEDRGEYDLVSRDGRCTPYFVYGRRFEWQGQRCIVGMGVDISERRAAEQQLQLYSAELKTLAQRLEQAQELERRNIARELHDGIGAALTAMQFILGRLEHEVGSAAGREILQQLRDMRAQLLTDIRELSLNLRPSLLDDLGLAAAVHWYARVQSSHSGLRIEASIMDSLPRFPAQVETACFRVLQGALTNVLRHAQASHVDVSLRQAGDALDLVVKDDGVGFDVASARAYAMQGNSLGLLAMEERVRLANGEFDMHSILGRGTEVHARFAVPATAST
ncbi:MAG: PAS domain S-box protein [Gammaproteobacteria bacterium]